MLGKKYRKIMMLSVTFALVVSSFAFSGQAEAANVMSMFNRVYKQATGTDFQGFGSISKQVQQPSQPQEPAQPAEPTEPEPVPPVEPSEPEPVNPVPSKPQPEPEKPVKMPIADKIIQSGEKYLGTPYKYGAPYGQTNTFDCSSFTKTVFAENGITLPRSTRQQVKVGTPVSRNELQKGDLIFTRTSYSNDVSHVAIYAGNGKVLHTYGPGGVRYDKLDGSWLDRAYITARRVIK